MLLFLTQWVKPFLLGILGKNYTELYKMENNFINIFQLEALYRSVISVSLLFLFSFYMEGLVYKGGFSAMSFKHT